MMRHAHPTDAELLLRADGALPRQRQADVDAHLGICSVCQRRTAELEIGLERLVDEDIRSTATGDARQTWARQRLEAALSARARERKHTRTFGWPAVLIAAGLTLCAALWLPLARSAAVRMTRVDAPILPIRALTPGAARDVGVPALCDGRAAMTPAIPPEVRQAVVRAYGMEYLDADQYELDYLITPELGGLPDVRNVWPEPYHNGAWNAFVKDDIEDRLSELVCRGDVDLRTAQRELADDWIAAYRKYFHTDTPIRTRAHAGPNPAAGL